MSTAFGQTSSYEAARFAEEHQRRVAVDDARKNLWFAVAGLAVVLITGAKVVMRRRQEEEANEDHVGEEAAEERDEAPEGTREQETGGEQLLGSAAPARRGPDKICVQCGASNAGTWKVCDECNAPL